MNARHTHQATRAERDFLDSLNQTSRLAQRYQPGASASPLDAARAVQQRIDDARPLTLPLPEVREVPFADLTRTERDSFFGAFDDTEPVGL